MHLFSSSVHPHASSYGINVRHLFTFCGLFGWKVISSDLILIVLVTFIPALSASCRPNSMIVTEIRNKFVIYNKLVLTQLGLDLHKGQFPPIITW